LTPEVIFIIFVSYRLKVQQTTYSE